MAITIENIIDSHQHFWKMSRGDYDWLTPELTKLYKDFLPSDYLEEIKNLRISKTVLVQASATEEETEFMLQLSKDHEFIAGVVGWIDFEGDPIAACRRLDLFSQSPFFKGIRPMLQDIEDVDWILNPEFGPIFERLIELDLTFDALVFTEHLDNIFFLANRYPGLKIVIDHCAKPDIANQKYDQWAQKLEMFKGLENVFLKVSGLPTEASESQQESTYFQRYINHVYQIFGSKRMMWGSDWPVVNINSDFSQWLQLTTELISDWSLDEIEDLFVRSASKFYSL